MIVKELTRQDAELLISGMRGIYIKDLRTKDWDGVCISEGFNGNSELCHYSAAAGEYVCDLDEEEYAAATWSLQHKDGETLLVATIDGRAAWKGIVYVSVANAAAVEALLGCMETAKKSQERYDTCDIL